MQIRLTSLVSGLTLGVLLAAPTFAQTTSDDNVERDLIRSCHADYLPEYRNALESAIKQMRGSILDQWKRQVDFRIAAVRASQRAAVTRVLQSAGRQVEGGLDAFGRTQTNGLQSDTNVVLDTFLRLDEEQEESTLERWSNRTVSFQALDAVLARGERTLRTYANTRDRATITRVLNETRRQAQSTFTQARNEARDAFVENINACVYGLILDDEEMTTEEKPEVKTDTSSSVETRFMVTRIQVDTVSDYAATCSQKVTARAYIYANGVGRTVGYFVYHDGQRSPEIVADTDAMGNTYVQHQREYNPSAGSFTTGWAKFVVTSPNGLSSNQADFKIECQGQNNGNQNTGTGTQTDNKSSEGPRFLEVQLARDGAGPLMTCGEYTVRYVGYIRMSQPNTSFTYHFVRSDGARSADQVATTNASGAANVYYNWTLGRPIYGWVRIVITQPYALAQSPAHSTDFTAVEKPGCTTPPPASTDTSASNNNTQSTPSIITSVSAMTTSKQEVAVCGNYLFTFKGTVSTNAATDVKYVWERSDGVRSPVGVLSFTGAGSQSVSESWNLGANLSGWVRLRTLGPVDMSSEPAAISIVQACK